MSSKSSDKQSKNRIEGICAQEPISDEALPECITYECPLSARTDDPRALIFDKAKHHFQTGLRLFDEGNIILSREHLAASFLLDDKTTSYAVESALTHDGVRSGIGLDMMQPLVIEPLMELENHTLSDCILHAMMVFCPFNNDTMKAMFQQVSTIALLRVIGGIEQNTVSAQNGLVLVCGTLASLNKLLGKVYIDMGNGKSGLKQFHTALELDPQDTSVRVLRLEFWVVTGIKSQSLIAAECRLILDQVHKDFCDTDFVYAVLAKAIFLDPRLGSYAEALQIYRQSLAATERRVKLYGPRDASESLAHLIRLEIHEYCECCLLYTSPSPRDRTRARMPSSA